MKYCPHCGTENIDNAQYCVSCGNPLQPAPTKPRETITDHLTFALNTATSHLKLFVPHIAIYLLVFGFLLILFFNIGISYVISDTFDPAMLPSATIKLFMLFFLVMLIIGILSTPFLQHLYKTAVQGETISYTESARYALSRFLAYLLADLVPFITMILILFIWFSTMPLEVLMNYPDIDYTHFWSLGIWLLILLPFAVIYYYALNIMTWDDIGLTTALRSSLNFLKNRLGMLLVLWIILACINAIIVKVPMGAVLSFVPSVIMDLATIDIYLHYKKPAQSPEPPVSPPEPPATPESTEKPA